MHVRRLLRSFSASNWSEVPSKSWDGRPTSQYRLGVAINLGPSHFQKPWNHPSPLINFFRLSFPASLCRFPFIFCRHTWWLVWPLLAKACHLLSNLRWPNVTCPSTDLHCHGSFDLSSLFLYLESWEVPSILPRDCWIQKQLFFRWKPVSWLFFKN